MADSATEIASYLDARPVDRPRLYEEVLERLESMIVSGRLRPGEKLPSERELTRLFGVGRTSIREALFALQRKGVVSTMAGGRPVVTEPRTDVIVSEMSGAFRYYLSTEAGMREFQKARRLMEVAFVRQAAQSATGPELAHLRRTLQENEAALDDEEHFVDTDVAFHFAIVQVSQSKLMSELHRAVFVWLRTQRSLSIKPAGSSHAAFKAHQRIFDAIVARDPQAAEAAMVRHLEDVEQYYWDAAAAMASGPSRKFKNKPLKSREEQI